MLKEQCPKIYQFFYKPASYCNKFTKYYSKELLLIWNCALGTKSLIIFLSCVGLRNKML